MTADETPDDTPEHALDDALDEFAGRPGGGAADPLEALAAEPAAAAVLGLAAEEGPGRPDGAARAIAAALAARPAGRPAGGPPPTGPIAALARTLDELGVLIDQLTEAEAARPTIEGWTVAGLVAHLTVVDRYFGTVMGWWDGDDAAGPTDDHLAMTAVAAVAASGRPIGPVRDRWREGVDRIGARLGSLGDRLDQRVRFHGFDFSIRSVLVARTFEVWTHTEDICRALGCDPVVPDVGRLRLMTDAAVRALPLGMLLGGREARDRTVRIVLTGDGGGAWVQSLEVGAAPGDPELTLVADAVEFCRLAARRRSAAELEVAVSGAGDDDGATAELVADVLRAAAVFAA